MDSWSRKAVGALKDVASVGFANMNGRITDIDVAVVKATRHNEIPPSEKHVLIAVTATNDRSLRRYLRRTIEERLRRTKNWMVAVKTLTLIHRLIRDALPTFADEEMRHSSDTTPLMAVSHTFEDSSSPLALEFSFWVRSYSFYLSQSLRCKRIVNHGIFVENQSKTPKIFETVQLLEDLRSLQQLLDCLLDCTPPREGPVAFNPLIHYALDLIVKECPEIYATINVRICKLLSLFFEMPSGKAVAFVDIYKRILQQYDKLSDFYDACSRMGITDLHGNYPSHKRFLVEMDDHIKKHRLRLSEMEDVRRSFNSICSQETTSKKETLQVAGEKQRPRITWWDSYQGVVQPKDAVTYRSNIPEQEATSYESNHEWEKALELSMMGSSSTSHSQSGDGIDRSQIPITQMEHRANPEMSSVSDLSLPVEVVTAHKDQEQQQHQEAVTDGRGHKILSLQYYLPANNTQKVGVVSQRRQPVRELNPSFHYV